MDVHSLPRWDGQGKVKQMVPSRLIGLQGRLARLFWGLMGIWAAICGMLASNHFQWDSEGLLSLALVLLLADLAWGSLWDLAAGTDWFQSLAQDWATVRPASLMALPYTRPDSPGGRLGRGLNRLVGWWREAFWPAAGPALLGLLAATVLTAVLSLFLPPRLRLLNAAFVAIIGLGIIWRRKGRTLWAGEALVMVGLCWLAGHVALAEISMPSLILALSFSVATWGGMRAVQGLGGGLWLLNGGQMVSVALLVALKQPLPAGLTGLLLLGQIALQPSLRCGGDAERIFRRMWPWLMATMLVAALALP